MLVSPLKPIIEYCASAFATESGTGVGPGGGVVLAGVGEPWGNVGLLELELPQAASAASAITEMIDARRVFNESASKTAR